MPFTARQLQGLDALGVVPWVLKDARNQTDSVVPAQQTASVSTATSELAVQPSTRDGLVEWLPTQSLAQFSYRGKTLDRIGREDAPVLFVMDELPLPDTQARLLNDMLRSIDLDPRDTCLVSLDTADSLVPMASVQTVLHAGIRAIIYCSDLHITEDPHADHAFDLNSIRGWCLPSLRKMQEQPQFKRQAWNSLKNLQGLLAG